MGNKEILLQTDEGIKPILQEEKGLELMYAAESDLLYKSGMGVDEKGQVAMELYSNDSKLTRLNLKTLKSETLLPDQPGFQWAFYTNGTDKMLIGNFVESESPTQSGSLDQMPGLIQLWEMDLQQSTTKKLYELSSTWGQHQMQMQPVKNTNGKQFYLKAPNFNAFAMLYDLEKSTIVPVDPLIVPMMEW
jgi:hypothetical protein